MTSTAIAWPEGVIARYLAVAGATVDVYDNGTELRAICTGCPAAEDVHRVAEITEDWVRRRVVIKTQEWAQTHAATCRAMPRPTA
ncbi:hypothetical protein HRW07_19350 [Streptomyces lunaelactis]|uniref:hypothetical protein n=1 Tax=Streptomyces lunaelactis TaxID=1535768 RepID=UPI0015848DA6|nr:hypothetical protein [Streptomyces lunaelactis]NUL05349.1 hypothetical protein [Streptomyces lunaelactis]